MKKLAFVLLFALDLVLSGSTVIRAQEADAKPDKEIVAEQYLLLGSATRACGESQLAVNPLNPNEIAVAAMCGINQNEGKFEHNDLAYERTPRAAILEFAITRDRGLTWTITEDPFRAYFRRYRAPDPFAAFAADGTMILGGETHFPVSLTTAEEQINEVKGAPQDFGGSNLIWSTDGGHTFSDPVLIISSYMPNEILGTFVSFAPMLSQGDRPQIRVDRSTGKLYVEGGAFAADPLHYQSIMRMSKDRGRDWGMVYAFDSAEWPGSWAAYDVANGIVGAAYIATSVPDELHAKCPCRVFGASTDDGKTFDRHLLPAPAPAGGGFGLGNITVVVGNPIKQGMFTVLITSPDGVDSYITEDAGKTWNKAGIVPAVPKTNTFNLTAAYNPKGVMALSWRAVYPVNTPEPALTRDRGPAIGAAYQQQKPHVFEDWPEHFEIWSAISRDGGRTFSAPFKVSTAQSPGVSRRRSMSQHGSDFISVDLDDDFVHMTWFDDRAGFRGTWYGRVPLADYK